MMYTGMDRTLPYTAVLMEKPDMNDYPRYDLPEGYTFAPFTAELEKAWVQLQLGITHVDSYAEGAAIFRGEFLGCDDPSVSAETCPGYGDIRARMLFVLDPDGALAGTAALWMGDTMGEMRPRVHWVAVRADVQGLGIAKAMLTRLCDLYHALGCTGAPYLTTQTWSYRAVGLYRRFGFVPYRGPKPDNWDFHTDLPDDYDGAIRKAWALIDEKTRR